MQQCCRDDDWNYQHNETFDWLIITINVYLNTMHLEFLTFIHSRYVIYIVQSNNICDRN